MNTVNMSEARRRLSDLVDSAERGQSVVITRRGRAVARIVPAQREARKPLPEMGDFRASLKVKGKSLSDTVVEMRAEERY